MSRERLGEALGVASQQVQKYESGVSRFVASRLFDLSRALDVPIHFFFDGPPDVPLSRRETLELVDAYYRVTDPAVRKRELALIKSLGSVET
jgi:transcriptional regulator with XRE-family HTH domain